MNFALPTEKASYTVEENYDTECRKINIAITRASFFIIYFSLLLATIETAGPLWNREVLTN